MNKRINKLPLLHNLFSSAKHFPLFSQRPFHIRVYLIVLWRPFLPNTVKSQMKGQLHICVSIKQWFKHLYWGTVYRTSLQITQSCKMAEWFILEWHLNNKLLVHYSNGPPRHVISYVIMTVDYVINESSTVCYTLAKFSKVVVFDWHCYQGFNTKTNSTCKA